MFYWYIVDWYESQWWQSATKNGNSKWESSSVRNRTKVYIYPSYGQIDEIDSPKTTTQTILFNSTHAHDEINIISPGNRRSKVSGRLFRNINIQIFSGSFVRKKSFTENRFHELYIQQQECQEEYKENSKESPQKKNRKELIQQDELNEISLHETHMFTVFSYCSKNRFLCSSWILLSSANRVEIGLRFYERDPKSGKLIILSKS